MTLATRYGWCFIGLLAAALAAGCLPSPSDKKQPTADPHAGHDHHHHGPHGGHIVEIGKEEYHAEWTHDDTGKIVVYLLDKDMKKAVPIAAETLKISITTIAKDGGKTTVPYELAAVNRTTGDMPTASQFELTDKVLLGGLETLAPGGVEAELEVDINGKVYQAKITHDEHHHH